MAHGGEKKYFTASEKCEMYNSLKKHENTGGDYTVIGKRYQIIHNDHEYYVFVKDPSAYPENRWVAKSCGVTEEKSHKIVQPVVAHFTPFFASNKDQVTKDQPLSPIITEFDQSALKTCGEWGNSVKYVDLNILFTGKALHSIYEALDYTIMTKNADINAFAKELTSIWLGGGAFEHVICGQPGHPKDHKLGGLHYVGRYWEAQKHKWAGLNKSCKKEEIKDSVYTIGVDFITPKGVVATKCPSGYNYDMNVYHIIVEGTKAFKEAYNQQGKDSNVACLFHNKQDDFVFVKKDDAIFTFYSDASPSASLKSCNNLS